VWLEPRAENADVSTAGRAIRVHTRDIGAGDSLTLRAVLPRSVLNAVDGLSVEKKPGLDKVLAGRTSHGRTWWPWIVAAAVVAVLSAAVALRTARWRRPPPR
jgi:anti-sigma-K factor RskA